MFSPATCQRNTHKAGLQHCNANLTPKRPPLIDPPPHLLPFPPPQLAPPPTTDKNIVQACSVVLYCTVSVRLAIQQESPLFIAPLLTANSKVGHTLIKTH